MPRGPSRPYPPVSLDVSAQVGQAIRDHNAGRPMNRILLAQSIGKSPTSSDCRDLLSASLKYGFTIGSFNAENIELTELGEQLTRPRSDSEKLDALRQGLRNISLFDKLLTHFNNSKLPPPEFLKNILERDPFRVSPEWSKEAADVFVAGGKSVGFIRDVSGAPYVVVDAGPPTPVTSIEVPTEQLEDLNPPQETDQQASSDSQNGTIETEIAPPDGRRAASTLQFFIAHGKDKESLGQLQSILNQLGIPYLVAEQEANSGRPISQKVKELMTSCSAGIFLFTADEEFKDVAGATLLRPRENVVYELGAASFLYDQRIVIFKEKGVTFPTDFQDLGYIEFEKGQLAGKTMELLRELIALKAVKLLPGG